MAKTQSTFPATIDSTLQTDRVSGDTITSDSYDIIEDAIFELETKVGIDNSPVTGSLDYVVNNPSGLLHSHATRHVSGGADPIKLDDLATPDDNTDLNVSTTAHGLCPKAPNNTTKFLRGDASWATPTGWQKIHEADLTTASDYTISGLDGNTDNFYMILLMGVLTAGGSDRILGIRPNGDTTSGNYNRGVQQVAQREGGTSFTAGVSWWGGTEAILPLGRNAWSDNGGLLISAVMNAKAVIYRSIRSQWSFERQGYTDYNLCGNAMGTWRNSATNITSLVFYFDGASDFHGKLVVFAMR
jgi:hypothetical protein